MMFRKHSRMKITLCTGIAVCLLVTAYYLFFHIPRDISQTGLNYATVTAVNFNASYMIYPSAEGAIRDVPLIIKGEIIEVIKPSTGKSYLRPTVQKR